MGDGGRGHLGLAMGWLCRLSAMAATPLMVTQRLLAVVAATTDGRGSWRKFEEEEGGSDGKLPNNFSGGNYSAMRGNGIRIEVNLGIIAGRISDFFGGFGDGVERGIHCCCCLLLLLLRFLCFTEEEKSRGGG